MACSNTLLAVFFFGGCADGGADIDRINEVLSSEQRPAADRDADAGRKPDEILAFFEIKPGMTVLDLFSGGGYYTEILSGVVGDEGAVLAHNNQAYLDYAKDDLQNRFTAGRLGNVQRIKAEASELELKPGSLDAVMMSLTYHDFYYLDEANGWGPIDTQDLLARLCRALKPGAVAGVIDHIAAEGSGVGSAQQLHRIEPAYVRREMESSCFHFDAESDVLRNRQDDHSKPMFAEGIRGKTDRFVYRFKRK